MSQSCFRIFTSLLILWQLILSCSAPWLHSCIQGCCVAAECEKPCDSARLVARVSLTRVKQVCSCLHHAKSAPKNAPESRDQRPAKSHDCSNCAVCQAIAAPRTLVAIVSLEASVETSEALAFTDCSDPLIGFDLATRCRAPPRLTSVKSCASFCC